MARTLGVPEVGGGDMGWALPQRNTNGKSADLAVGSGVLSMDARHPPFPLDNHHVWRDHIRIIHSPCVSLPAWGACELSSTKLPYIPQIGAVVRWKMHLFGNGKGTTGRVRAILSEDSEPTVVIQSIWGAELSISAKEFPRFFEECGPLDAAWTYWAGS